MGPTSRTRKSGRCLALRRAPVEATPRRRWLRSSADWPPEKNGDGRRANPASTPTGPAGRAGIRAVDRGGGPEPPRPTSRTRPGDEAAYRGAVRRAGVAPRFGFATLVAAAAVLVVAMVVVRPLAVDGPGSSTSPDLLGRPRAEGTIRMAVTGDAPQTTTAGGAVIEFDVDVARELARSLGLDGEITVVASTDILDGRVGDWDIGLPSRRPLVGSGVTAGPAYLPVAVLARHGCDRGDDDRG